MRPIRLTMQAFGPYAETQLLEMDNLGEKGIYAIIGETGTGKTTIFDAIVYALYGTGSGEDRSDGRSLRAIAARPDLETKVELEFVCGGRTYTIIRKPTQSLTGKRSKELVENKGSVVLIMPDGTRHTNSGEIDGTRNKPGIIEQDILGVTKDQFCQTVMIAQGEFRKLLRSKTDERTEILRRIFRTQRFDALARNLDHKCKLKWDELSECRRQASFSLKAMRTQEGTLLFEALEAMKNAKAEELLLKDALDLASQLSEADGTEQKTAQEARKKAESARDLAKQAFDRAKELQEKRKRRSSLNKSLQEQQTELDDAKKRYTDAEARRPEIAELNEQIVNNKLLLPKYTDLENMKAEIRQTTNLLTRVKTNLSEAIKKEKELTQEQEELSKEANSLAGAADRKLAAAQALRDVQDRKKILDTLNTRVEARDTALQTLQKSRDRLMEAARKATDAASALKSLIQEKEGLGNTAQLLTKLEGESQILDSEATSIEKLEQLMDDLKQAKSTYDEEMNKYSRYKNISGQKESEAHQLRDLYNANIAGLWAQKLKKDEPCPVCGSLHHPSPAVLTEKSVTEDDVQNAETEAEEAKKVYNEQAQICAGKKAVKDSLQLQLTELFENVPDEEWQNEIERRKQANIKAKDQLKKDINAAREADNRFQTIVESEEPKKKHDAEKAETDMHDMEAEVRSAEGKLETAEKEVSAAANGLMPDDWTELDLSDAIAESNALEDSHQKAVNQAETDMTRITQIESRQKVITEDQRKISSEMRDKESERSRYETQLEERCQNYETLRGTLPWPTAKDCSEAITKQEQQINEMEEAIHSSAEEVEKLNRVIADTEGQIKTLNADLENAPDEDPEMLETEYQARQTEYEIADEQKSLIDGRKQNNAEHRKTLEKQATSALALEQEYRVMQDVADTANGRVKGKSKITLETYVQTAYFDRIINYANRRLIHMSRQQYDLARQNVEEGSKQGKTGLELDVVDHVNGQRRAVSTLSGGEGFLAALSFALGLSDAIQDNAASAVQLDTMFVDEGFGSLSDNYLSLVMDELNETANAGHRLIGIISHVDEVKDGIDRRIEVTKNADGISTAEIH